MSMTIADLEQLQSQHPDWQIELFLELGAVVGILIDPDKRTLTVYRLNQSPVTLCDGDVLTVPELLPGWELAISELWPPVFD